MTACFTGPFRMIVECIQGPSIGATTSYATLQEEPDVKFDTAFQGAEIVTVKNGKRVCGSGGVLANAPIVQNKAYFEVKIQQSGAWGVGLAPRIRKNLDSLPPLKASASNDPAAAQLGVLVVDDDTSQKPANAPDDTWLLRDDGQVYFGSTQKGGMVEKIEEGDILGFSYDHVELLIYKNGEQTDCCISGVKGTLFPAVFVDDGAIVDVAFKNFWNSPPSGFGEILLEQTLL